MTPSDPAAGNAPSAAPAVPPVLMPPCFKTPFFFEDGKIVDSDGELVAECRLAPGSPDAAGELLAETLADYWEDEGLAFEEPPAPEPPRQRRLRLAFNVGVVLLLAALALDRFWPFLPTIGSGAPAAACAAAPGSACAPESRLAASPPPRG